VYEKNCWAMTRKSYNSNGDCAYAHDFPVLAEDPDVVILRTSAINGDMSFCGEEPWLTELLDAVTLTGGGPCR
jgi:hypothetical protein